MFFLCTGQKYLKTTVKQIKYSCQGQIHLISQELSLDVGYTTWKFYICFMRYAPRDITYSSLSKIRFLEVKKVFIYNPKYFRWNTMKSGFISLSTFIRLVNSRNHCIFMFSKTLVQFESFIFLFSLNNAVMH